MPDPFGTLHTHNRCPLKCWNIWLMMTFSINSPSRKYLTTLMAEVRRYSWMFFFPFLLLPSVFLKSSKLEDSNTQIGTFSSLSHNDYSFSSQWILKRAHGWFDKVIKFTSYAGRCIVWDKKKSGWSSKSHESGPQDWRRSLKWQRNKEDPWAKSRWLFCNALFGFFLPNKWCLFYKYFSEKSLYLLVHLLSPTFILFHLLRRWTSVQRAHESSS